MRSKMTCIHPQVTDRVLGFVGSICRSRLRKQLYNEQIEQ
jgi:hypothetical protein